MTDQDQLRDARLAQALQHMPDAHMQASAATRLAVLQRAQDALADQNINAPPVGRRWWHWRHWLLGTTPGNSPSPAAWGGALASVLVASFVTLMWYGQPVPDANPDGPPVTAQETAAPPAKETAVADITPAKPAPLPVPMQQRPPSVAEKKREAPMPAPQSPVPPSQALAAAPAPAPQPILAPPAAAVAPESKAFAKSQATDRALAQPYALGAAASASVPTSAPSVAFSGALSRRNRAKLTTADTTTITRDGKITPMSASQATVLLAALRALPYKTQANDLHDTADSPVLTVQSAQGEVWSISPQRVQLRHIRADAGVKQNPPTSFSNITDVQWQELRSLAQAAP